MGELPPWPECLAGSALGLEGQEVATIVRYKPWVCLQGRVRVGLRAPGGSGRLCRGTELNLKEAEDLRVPLYHFQNFPGRLRAVLPSTLSLGPYHMVVAWAPLAPHAAEA